MRKVLSFVLVLALVLGSFSMAFAAPFSDMTGEASSEAVEVLKDLGVVAGYPDGTFRPDQIVTRAEMARFIIASLGLEQFATGTTSKYPDMVQAPWAQGYVAYATSIGFISGYPDGTFKPNQQVSYQEAASMLVRALGYTEAFLPGGWPAEWMIKANSLGIFDDVSMTSGAAGANRGDIAQMLYNALELEIGQVNNDNVWNAFVPSDTMLIRLGAKFIAADDAKALTGAGFEADGVIYGDEDTKINLRAYVGAYADRYVNKNDDIIKVIPQSIFLTGDYNYDDNLFEADNGTDYNISRAIAYEGASGYVGDVPVFYNGEYDHDCDLDSHDEAVTIAVKVSGKTIKNLYSIGEWYVDDAFKVTADILTEFADDMTMESNEFFLDDNDDIDMMSFELDGVAGLDAIKKDNIVYIYLGDDSGLIRKIEVGTETVTGKITKINMNADQVTLAGKVYDKADVAALPTFTLALGETGTAYLDINGDIASWKVTDKTAGNYALVISTAVGNALDDDRIKLLVADGTKPVFDVDSDAYATGVTIGGFVKGDLVAYSVDKNGVIDEINELTKVEATGKLSASGAVFGGKAVDAAVVVFEVTALDDFTTMDVAKLADVDRDNTIVIDTYTDGKIEVMIVESDDLDGGKATVYAVINKVTNALNDDDKSVHYVYGFADGKAFEAYTDKTSYFTGYDAVSSGPGLWALDVDADGVIIGAEFDNDGLTLNLEYENGSVASKDGWLVKIGTDWYTIDPATVIYAFDYDKTSNPYSLKAYSAVKTDEYVVLTQLDEDSEYFDFILLLLNAI